EIVPLRVRLKEVDVAKYGSAAAVVLQEDARQPARDLLGDFPERQQSTRSGRTLDLVGVAEVMMKLLQRLDDQEVDGEPDRAAPVRVAAEQPAARFGRLVVDPVFRAVD